MPILKRFGTCEIRTLFLFSRIFFTFLPPKQCHKEDYIRPPVKMRNLLMLLSGSHQDRQLPDCSTRPQATIYESQFCNKCGGVCHGHYLTPEEVLPLDNGRVKSAYISPPNAVIKDTFDSKQNKTKGLVLRARTGW